MVIAVARALPLGWFFALTGAAMGIDLVVRRISRRRAAARRWHPSHRPPYDWAADRDLRRRLVYPTHVRKVS